MNRLNLLVASITLLLTPSVALAVDTVRLASYYRYIKLPLALFLVPILLLAVLSAQFSKKS